MRKLIVCLILAICLIGMLFVSPSCETYEIILIGKVITIAESKTHLAINLEGYGQSLVFNWDTNKTIPFEIGKTYRIKYETGTTSFSKLTLLDWEIIN